MKSAKKAHREKEDRRLTKLMLIIFICFVVCFLPLMLVNVCDKDVRYPTVHVIASILAWFSSVINPFIYAASNRQYRQAYRKLFDNVKSSKLLFVFCSSPLLSFAFCKDVILQYNVVRDLS